VAKLRRLVQDTVLDWRGALRAGTIAGQRRLRRLALDRAAAGDDLALMQELVARGCDPAVAAAVNNRDVAVVELLARGCRREVTGRHGSSAGYARGRLRRRSQGRRAPAPDSHASTAETA
jgi:uncharacterized protein YgbK (DUF1537 family)